MLKVFLWVFPLISTGHANHKFCCILGGPSSIVFLCYVDASVHVVCCFVMTPLWRAQQALRVDCPNIRITNILVSTDS